MPLVRILKSQGFEQAGDLVDYRGVDLDEKIAAGEMMRYEDELAQQETVEPEPQPIEPEEPAVPETSQPEEAIEGE